MSILEPRRMSASQLVARAAELAQRPGRSIVGICGAPGSGKTTLADAVVAGVNEANPGSAIAVPMDGFHLANQVLEDMGARPRKGAPHTFDAWGFLALIERLAAVEHTVYAPEYRRDLKEPVAGAISVPPEIPLVIVEGNYLLLEEEPWNLVRNHLTETWFVSLDPETRLRRLIDRHVHFGMSVAAARRHAQGSDQKNAQLIETTAGAADLVVRLTD